MRGDVLIIFTAIFLPVSFIITYFMATESGHVEKEFPYISDTGTYPPESCVFAFLLVIYSISTFLTVHSRWEIIRNYIDENEASRKINNVSFALGATASLGVMLVACFQETNVLMVHLLGALAAFGVGSLYMMCNAYLTYRVHSVPGWLRPMSHVRLFLAFITSCCFLLTMCLSAVAEGNRPSNETRTSEAGSGKWTSNMDGYDIHIASTSFEWALAGFTTLFFLSFIFEFRQIRIGLPAISMAVLQSSVHITESDQGSNCGNNSNYGYSNDSGQIEPQISTILQEKDSTAYDASYNTAYDSSFEPNSPS